MEVHHQNQLNSFLFNKIKIVQIFAIVFFIDSFCFWRPCKRGDTLYQGLGTVLRETDNSEQITPKTVSWNQGACLGDKKEFGKIWDTSLTPPYPPSL